MKFSVALIAAIAAHVSAHGVITQITGANNVVMPGLSVVDGTPRDCSTKGCGAEEDTSIIRDREIGTGRASALGRNQAGPVDAGASISKFMGSSTTSVTSADAVNKRQLANLLGGGKAGGLLGGAGGGKAGGLLGGAGGGKTGGLLSGIGGGSALRGATGAGGTPSPQGTTEQGVAKAAGAGATSGLPTCADDGTITMTFHQVNQDGAGPLSAQIDPTSGGTDPNAFQDAQVTQNVPGLGVGGLSTARATDFPLKVQMPQGMTCSGTAGGAKNVCIVRVRNTAAAGPFGGSAAFTMSTGAKKRAVEYNLRKREAEAMKQ